MTDFDRDEASDLFEFEDAVPTRVDDLAELPMAEMMATVNAMLKENGL